MEFEDQLQKAISRGKERGASRQDSERRQLNSSEDIRKRHNDYRLDLSDYIEESLRKLVLHFPGFEYETIFGERGWGGAIYRDDIARGPDGRAGSFFSRIEITVRPQNEFNVVNITGKGTVKNKEIFSWNFYKDIVDSTEVEFKEKIESWILQYAEQFASQ